MIGLQLFSHRGAANFWDSDSCFQLLGSTFELDLIMAITASTWLRTPLQIFRSQIRDRYTPTRVIL